MIYENAKPDTWSLLHQIYAGPFAFYKHLSTRRYLREFQNGLDSASHRFNTAAEVHEQLSRALGARINFFSDRPMVELNDYFDGGKMSFQRLSSLDIMAYAYLKEQLVNTPNAKETLYWQANYLNLSAFVKFSLQKCMICKFIIKRMDIFIEQNMAIDELEKREIYLQIDTSSNNLLKLEIQFPQEFELTTSDRVVYVPKEEEIKGPDGEELRSEFYLNI